MNINYDVILSQWELFLLILVRIASFVYTAPFFSTGNTPQRVKIGLSIFLSYLIFTILPEQSYSYTGVIGYAILILQESIIGLVIGFAANLCMQTIHFAGHIIDVNIGLSMATMYDPATRMQVNISGNLYYYLIFLLMLVSDLHQFLINAIVDVYTIIPVGQVTVSPGIYTSVTSFIADYFIIGFRIALPVFVCIMLLNCILGILARIAPQMNMFAVGMQIKLLLGLVIMYITVSMLPSVARYLMQVMKNVIVRVVEGMY